MAKSVPKPPPDPFLGSVAGLAAYDKLRAHKQTYAPPTNYIYIAYDPNLSPRKVKPQCGSIRFVQVVRSLFNDRPINFANYDSKWEFQRAYTTDDFYCVDFLKEAKDPYYVTAYDFAINIGEGSTDYPVRSAGMADAPSQSSQYGGDRPFMGWRDSFIREGLVAELKHEFETFACCAAGADCRFRGDADVAAFGGPKILGSFYEGIKWTWVKTYEEARKDELGTSTIVAQNLETPSKEFLGAYELFLKLSGYKPCSR